MVGVSSRFKLLRVAGSAAFLAAVCARAAVPAAAPAKALQVTLRSGFDITCDHVEQVGDKARLYLHSGGNDFLDVAQADIVTTQTVELPQAPVANEAHVLKAVLPLDGSRAVDLEKLTSSAGAHNNLDADLIASIVRQESAGNPHAVSRAGARGLMQLMPGTAARQGVSDSFDPSQNVEGGTAYFNSLLLKYHDNLPLALAAYNAGPAAVDRYHGIPPYRETRAYVARIIRDFNRRKAELARAQRAAASHAPVALAAVVLH